MSPYNLLLVDDEKPFIEILAQRLRQRGYAAAPVFSGAEALERLATDDTVDVVVLDVKMPGLDGIETLQALKKRHPLVEVIMLTAHGTIATAIEAMKRGAFDYLTKPCELADLIAKADRAAARKKTRETRILDVRMRPYITRQERDALIARIMNE